MTESIQYSLFRDTHEQKAYEYFHSEEGRRVMDLFIKIAYGCWKRGQRVGAKAIWERIRWHYEIARKHDGQQYALNNSFTPYAARFAEARCLQLKGYFAKRTVGKRIERKAIVVPVRVMA